MRSCDAASSSRSHRGTPGGCSKEADLKPHLIRYWLTPAADEPDEMREERIAEVCTTYQEAPARAAAGERIVSTDEMTGVQALERAAPSLPLRQWHFVSDNLNTQVLDFLAYFNRTMAKPFKWTYLGKRFMCEQTWSGLTYAGLY